MKRFFRFVYRLLKIAAVVAALILLAVLLTQQTTLTEQVGALSTRVHTLEQATPARPAPGSQAPDPSRNADRAPTDTPTPTRPCPRRPDTHTHADSGRLAGVLAVQYAHTHADSDREHTPVPAPTGTPTRPPTATATDTSTPAPTRTPTRPPTATATVTPVAAPHFIVNSDHVNVRRGPDPAFSIIGTVARGERFDIGARNNSGTWLEFCCVNDERGWIYAPLLILSHDMSEIPVAANIPTRPSPTPTNTPAPQPPSNGGRQQRRWRVAETTWRASR